MRYLKLSSEKTWELYNERIKKPSKYKDLIELAGKLKKGESIFLSETSKKEADAVRQTLSKKFPYWFSVFKINEETFIVLRK